MSSSGMSIVKAAHVVFFVVQVEVFGGCVMMRYKQTIGTIIPMNVKFGDVWCSQKFCWSLAKVLSICLISWIFRRCCTYANQWDITKENRVVLISFQSPIQSSLNLIMSWFGPILPSRNSHEPLSWQISPYLSRTSASSFLPCKPNGADAVNSLWVSDAPVVR